MNPSDAIHSVTFQQQVTTQNDYGESVTTWANVTGRVGVPAMVLTGPGREAIVGGSKNADIDLRVTCWWFSGLDTTWRVSWNGNTYDIVAALLDMTAQREWRLDCKLIGDGT